VPVRQGQCVCGTARPAEDAADAPAGAAEVRDGPAWFAVSPAKLAFMSVITVGLYQFYWFYRQWRAVRDAGEDIRPLPRCIFGVIFCWGLFSRMAASAESIPAPAAPPALLTAIYIAACLSASVLPFPYAMVSLLSVVPLVIAQRTANAVAQHDFPEEAPETRFTAANWAGIALGCAFFGVIGYALVKRANIGSLESLSRVADEINRQPHAPTDGVQLERVVPQQGLLIYHFTVTGEAQAKLEERKPLLKAAVRRGVCRDALVKMGVAVRFVYSGPLGEDLATVDIAPGDCP
jgi:hypothetical protein